MIEPGAPGTQATLRQLAATLAYRAAKVLREVPPGFATYRIAPNARTAATSGRQSSKAPTDDVDVNLT